jgi:hypothetical protein
MRPTREAIVLSLQAGSAEFPFGQCPLLEVERTLVSFTL